MTANMASLQRTKSVLRKDIKNILKTLPEHQKQLESAIIQQKVLGSEVYKRSQRISIFLSTSEEVNTIPIVKSMLESGKQCFIPHCEGPDMIMIRLESWEAYVNLPTNSLGIKEPQDFNSSNDAIFSGGLDLMFMPGLAFTEKGARLGRGKGYYDKYLQRCAESGKSPYTMALLFKEQLVSDIPTTELDVSVDSLIYPTQQEMEEFQHLCN